MGIVHLNPLRITETGDPEFPLEHTADDGTVTRLHHTRVLRTEPANDARWAKIAQTLPGQVFLEKEAGSFVEVVTKTTGRASGKW